MTKGIKKLLRQVTALGLGVYAANGAYFLVLAMLPALELMTQLAQVLPEEPALALQELVGRYVPPWMGQELTGSVPVLGIAAVWSASRGLYGLVLGLRAVYGIPSRRRWLAGRLLCLGYALGALAAGVALLPLARRVLSGGAVTALAVQTAAFAGLYLTVSGGKNSVCGAFAGAGAASIGCLALTRVWGWGLGAVAPGSLYGAAGTLVAVYLWAWLVLLGAFVHARLGENWTSDD